MKSVYYTQQQFAITLSFPSTNVTEFHFNWQQSTSVIQHLLLEWHTSRTVASENTLRAASDWFWAQQDHLRSEGCDRVQQTACSLHSTPSSDTSSHVAENWTMFAERVCANWRCTVSISSLSISPTMQASCQKGTCRSQYGCFNHFDSSPIIFRDCSRQTFSHVTGCCCSQSLSVVINNYCAFSCRGLCYGQSFSMLHYGFFTSKSITLVNFIDPDDPRFQMQNMEHLWRDVQGGIPCFRRC